MKGGRAECAVVGKSKLITALRVQLAEAQQVVHALGDELVAEWEDRAREVAAQETRLSDKVVAPR